MTMWIWPLTGSGVMVPGSLTWTPKPSKTKKSRKRLPGFGSPR